METQPSLTGVGAWAELDNFDLVFLTTLFKRIAKPSMSLFLGPILAEIITKNERNLTKLKISRLVRKPFEGKLLPSR